MARTKHLPPRVREWLRARVETEGLRNTAKALDLADATIARAAGDLAIQAGTAAILEAAYRASEEAA